MEDVDGELGWFSLAFMLAEEGAREQVWSFWRRKRKLYIVRANNNEQGGTFVGYVLGQGNNDLRMGLMKCVPPQGPPCAVLLFFWLSAKVFALLRVPGDEFVRIYIRLHLKSRFMMLSGVIDITRDCLSLAQRDE